MIGIDIGGTFTDLVLRTPNGELATRKVASTPDDYSRGIAEGIAALLAGHALSPGSIDGVVHATTVATNTVLEHKGARMALITTAGFRDVLEMRRLRIPVMYDLQYEKPAPLVPRRLRFEVRERMGPKGEVWQPLEAADVEAAAAAMRDEKVAAVAICLLHAYANPAHEEQIEEMLRARLGEGLFITRSSDILPEIREYERTSTTVVNAYIGPTVAHYLRSLLARLRALGLTCPVQIMHSAGGTMTIDGAMRRPAYLLESGPAAGVIACARIAQQVAEPNVISFDMGGTTAKAAIVERGEPAQTGEYEVGAGINLSSKLVKGGGYPVKLPFIDVSEIGAGGGSIIAVDPGGRVAVGPRSAGAVPGPACYDLGGTDPTLTDALVTLGYLNPRYLVGGALPLVADKAQASLKAVADAIGRDAAGAAHGVLTIAVATMTRAVKAVSTYRGRDPRDFVLVAFGGNGPVVAAEIARSLGMRRILIPPGPGVFSALGLLLSDVENVFTQTVLGRWAAPTAERVADAFARLADQAQGAMLADGYRAADIELRRVAELRYAGQAYELAVPVPDGAIDLAALAETFGVEHERTYGHRAQHDPVDLVNLKVIARYRSGADAGVPAGGGVPPGAPVWRQVYFGAGEGWRNTPVVGRQALDEPTEGPLVIEEYDATCVVPPGATARLDAAGNIVIALPAGAP